MRRSVYFLLLVFASLIMSAQDTLYMNDGTRLPVKLIEVKDDVVRYKNWSNQNGPTWVKPRSSIVEIKRGNVDETTDFSSARNLSKKEIASHINSLYYNGIASRDIPQYVKSLPKNISTNELGKHYFQRFEKASNEDIEADIIREGEIYLYIGEEKLYIGEEKKFTYIVSSLAKIYAKNDNEAKVNELIDKFEKFSKDNFDMFDTEIEQLKKDTYELLHPKELKDEYVGTWVALNSGYEDESPLIIKIDDTRPDGANMLLPDESVTLIKRDNMNEIYYKRQLNVSQGVLCDGNRKVCKLHFASQKVRDNTWLTEAVHDGIEGLRSSSADMVATIVSSTASIGEKLGYGLLTSLAFTGLELLVSGATKSSTEVFDYKFELSPPSNSTVDGSLHYTSAKLTNDGKWNYNTKPSTTPQKFVKWEESDSVVFVSSNKKPIVTRPFSYDEPLLAEYNQIKQKTSFWRPQYCVPFFVGNATGIGMMVLGGIGKSSKNASWTIGLSGCAVFLLSNIVPECVRKHKRSNLFEDLNTRNYNKLKRKVPTEMSFAPIYDPMDNTIGASVNLKF